MFSGLVFERGWLSGGPEPVDGGGSRLRIAHSGDLGQRLTVGASLAVSGVCLTVTELLPGVALADLSPETLARTTLGALRDGAAVNLEPALRAGDALGGHWVQGHVDATAEVVEIRPLGEHREVRLRIPPELSPFVVEKGSVTVDGVSLTISRVEASDFSVALIPHTLAVTTLGELRAGQRVNLEVDILSKYVQRALAARGLA